MAKDSKEDSIIPWQSALEPCPNGHMTIAEVFRRKDHDEIVRRFKAENNNRQNFLDSLKNELKATNATISRHQSLALAALENAILVNHKQSAALLLLVINTPAFVYATDDFTINRREVEFQLSEIIDKGAVDFESALLDDAIDFPWIIPTMLESGLWAQCEISRRIVGKFIISTLFFDPATIDKKCNRFLIKIDNLPLDTANKDEIIANFLGWIAKRIANIQQLIVDRHIGVVINILQMVERIDHQKNHYGQMSSLILISYRGTNPARSPLIDLIMDAIEQTDVKVFDLLYLFVKNDTKDDLLSLKDFALVTRLISNFFIYLTTETEIIELSESLHFFINHIFPLAPNMIFNQMLDSLLIESNPENIIPTFLERFFYALSSATNPKVPDAQQFIIDYVKKQYAPANLPLQLRDIKRYQLLQYAQTNKLLNIDLPVLDFEQLSPDDLSKLSLFMLQHILFENPTEKRYCMAKQQHADQLVGYAFIRLIRECHSEPSMQMENIQRCNIFFITLEEENPGYLRDLFNSRQMTTVFSIVYLQQPRLILFLLDYAEKLKVKKESEWGEALLRNSDKPSFAELFADNYSSKNTDQDSADSWRRIIHRLFKSKPDLLLTNSELQKACARDYRNSMDKAISQVETYLFTDHLTAKSMPYNLFFLIIRFVPYFLPELFWKILSNLDKANYEAIVIEKMNIFLNNIQLIMRIDTKDINTTVYNDIFILKRNRRILLLDYCNRLSRGMRDTATPIETPSTNPWIALHLHIIQHYLPYANSISFHRKIVQWYKLFYPQKYLMKGEPVDILSFSSKNHLRLPTDTTNYFFGFDKIQTELRTKASIAAQASEQSVREYEIYLSVRKYEHDLHGNEGIFIEEIQQAEIDQTVGYSLAIPGMSLMEKKNGRNLARP